jgi:GNAT superfamily N-acetyltransferase
VTGFTVREARAADLEAIIRLHESDTVGGHGDAWTPENGAAYHGAFAAIQRSADNALFVAVDGGEVIGTFQITLIPSLTSRGALRAKLESVQVRSDRRSQGIGARMIAFAEEAAKARGAAVLELTSNKRRTDAHRFYERLGYARSHEGFKKPLGT